MPYKNSELMRFKSKEVDTRVTGAEKFQTGYAGVTTTHTHKGKVVREYAHKDAIPKYDGMDIFNAFAVGMAGMGVVIAIVIRYL